MKVLTLTKERKDQIGKILNRFWLAGIVFNLVHALLKVARAAILLIFLKNVSDRMCDRLDAWPTK